MMNTRRQRAQTLNHKERVTIILQRHVRDELSGFKGRRVDDRLKNDIYDTLCRICDEYIDMVIPDFETIVTVRGSHVHVQVVER